MIVRKSEYLIILKQFNKKIIRQACGCQRASKLRLASFKISADFILAG